MRVRGWKTGTVLGFQHSAEVLSFHYLVLLWQTHVRHAKSNIPNPGLISSFLETHSMDVV
jgi:hypothetical protein